MTKNDLLLLVGQNLRKYRTERKLTQEALAGEASISHSHYAALENGRKFMSMLVLRRLADALNVSVDRLLKDSDNFHQIESINSLLENRSDEFIEFIEKMIRFCVDELEHNK